VDYLPTCPENGGKGFDFANAAQIMDEIASLTRATAVSLTTVWIR